MASCLSDRPILKKRQRQVPLSPFPKQIGPSQVSLLSVVSFAVESLAVASLATANFLAEVDFARSIRLGPRLSAAVP